MRRCFIFLLFLTGFSTAHAQANTERWAFLFHRSFDGVHSATEVLWDSVGSLPDARQIISALEANKEIRSSEAGRIKLNLLKLRYRRRYGVEYDQTGWRILGADA
ncbi:MAG TPA: hypothetical protein VM871_12070, partial [Flavisolibacter sp.]|nr:hypothetical protein [Flavisolibacter sp.]